MKILFVNCVYKEESTGKIVYDLVKNLNEKKVQSVVCYGRGYSKASKSTEIRICTNLYGKFNKLLSMISGYMYGGCIISTSRLIRIILHENPDIVHLHCINGNFVNIYRLIQWLKLKRIKTIITLHAEFMYTANCGYSLDCEKWKSGCFNCERYKEVTHSLFFNNTSLSWNKMRKSFEGFERDALCVSVSPWLEKRAQEAPILNNLNQLMILNGIDSDIFKLSKNDKLRQQLISGKEKLIIYVTASFDRPIKGGKYIIEVAKKMPNYQFIIIGNEKKVDCDLKNISFLGRIGNQDELAKLYSIADVSVLTSQKETFGMTVVEALCCGTPVVGFQSGAPEEIALSEYSDFVEFGRTDLLIRALENMLKRHINKREISEKAIRVYSSKAMADKYYSIYKSMIE